MPSLRSPRIHQYEDSAAISPQRGAGVAGQHGSAQRGVEVVALGVEPPQPLQLLRTAQVGIRSLGQVKEVGRMGRMQPVLLACLGQPLGAERPYRLEHPVTPAVSVGRLVHRLDQRLVREAGQHVDDIGRGQPAQPAHPLGRRQRGTAREDGEPPREHLLGVVEQVPAPLHHRAQRLVSRLGGAVAAGQQPEPVVQPGGDLRQRQCAQPRRGQLDRQWQAVERPADPQHRAGVAGVDREVRRTAAARSANSRMAG